VVNGAAIRSDSVTCSADAWDVSIIGCLVIGISSTGTDVVYRMGVGDSKPAALETGNKALVAWCAHSKTTDE